MDKMIKVFGAMIGMGMVGAAIGWQTDKTAWAAKSANNAAMAKGGAGLAMALAGALAYKKSPIVGAGLIGGGGGIIAEAAKAKYSLAASTAPAGASGSIQIVAPQPTGQLPTSQTVTIPGVVVGSSTLGQLPTVMSPALLLSSGQPSMESSMQSGSRTQAGFASRRMPMYQAALAVRNQAGFASRTQAGAPRGSRGLYG